jgi:arginyl-tRNA synthetase
MKLAVEIALNEALKAAGVLEPGPIEVQVPKDETHGDLASPVALGLAKTLRKAPRAIAEELIGHLKDQSSHIFESVEIAGPGFLNFKFKTGFLHKGLNGILSNDEEAFRSDIGAGTRVQVEFVSANPTGPLHVGHGRGAALGCALSNLLMATGYDVVREYYVNDAGQQVLNLAGSVLHYYYKRFEIDYKLPEDGYLGEYVKEIADAFFEKYGDAYKNSSDTSDSEAITSAKKFALEQMVSLIKKDLASFNVHFDNWQSEEELHTSGAVQHAVDFLTDKGLIYEEGGARWFRSEDFGDDKNRVVIKADGNHTYFASDIAYHLKKVESGFTEVIDIWGADHHGYVPRMEAVMDALGPGRDHLKVLLVQMVSLMRGGEPVQMSKRSGNFVTLDEVMDEVGADTTKFIFLTRKHDSQLTFDLEVAKAESSENPVFYIQYVNARISSIFRKAEEEGVSTDMLINVNLEKLMEDDELRLIKKLLGYRMTLEGAALAREPHRLTFYLQELAGLFHPFYKRHRVLTEDAELTRARLALCEAVRIVIRHALSILGISAPDKM